MKQLVKRSLEQLFFTVEVVIKRAHADVGGLGDLQHRRVRLAGDDEPLRGLDQRSSGALPTPFQPVGRHAWLVRQGFLHSP